MITPTMDEVRQALKAAMETQGPDFIYSDGNGFCAYVPMSPQRIAQNDPDSRLKVESGDPRTVTGCLVGTALEILGVPRVKLTQDGIHSLQGRIGVITSRLIDVIRLTPDQVNYLAEAQVAQDTGDTWGAAFDRAEDSLS